MREILKDTFDVLTFRISREKLMGLGGRHLAFGLACTWLAGMGRYWDDPGAKLAQHLGLGSVIYVFFLASLLWAVGVPLKIPDWSWKRMLTFISLTAPLAWLYATPVERWVSLAKADLLNMWFLLLVATWRVALLVFYLGRAGGLSWRGRITASFLPMTLVVTALTALNLERVVCDAMGGYRGSSHDAAYGVLFILTLFSMLAVLPLLISYGILIWVRRRKKA